MWWDESAPRKVNVRLRIVGRKKEFIHKLDLTFETDEVYQDSNIFLMKARMLTIINRLNAGKMSQSWQVIIFFHTIAFCIFRHMLNRVCT